MIPALAAMKDGERVDRIGLMLVMEAFDKLDGAASRVLTALPEKMTEAAANLDHARIGMRAALQSLAISAAREAAAREDERNG